MLFMLLEQRSTRLILLCVVFVVEAFTLVRSADLTFNIPVVLMISNPSNEVSFRGILSGATQCVAKPVVDPRSLKDIWQHVVGKRRHEFISNLSSAKPQGPVNMKVVLPKMSSQIGREAAAVACRGGPSCSNPKILTFIKEGGEGSDQDQDNPTKPRFVWTEDLHQMFLDAVKYLNQFKKIVPTKILDYMRTKGARNITRENVASHLQKYRLYLKKYNTNAVDQSSNGVQSCPSKQNVGSSSPSTSYLPFQNLVKQEQQQEPPPNQPNNIVDVPYQDLTKLPEQQEPPPPPNEPNTPPSNEINWDAFGRIPIQNSTGNDLDCPTTLSSYWDIENYEPQPSLPLQVQEENNVFAHISHILNGIEPSFVPNQFIDDNGYRDLTSFDYLFKMAV